MNARDITVDWLNFYQPRRKRLQYYDVMDSRQSFICPPEVCAAMLDSVAMFLFHFTVKLMQA